MSLKADFARDFIDLPAAAQIESARWEAFQVAYLNNARRFAVDVKARQIAWSFTAGLDAVCDSAIEPGAPYIFVSINLDEAREKIRYVRSILEAVRPDVAHANGMELARDSMTEIELKNGTRFVSHPCRPVRGKARARVYLDEMAHYAEGLDRQIYLAALPATTKGGYIRIGSSPLGARGLFWEIATESLKQWPGYVRRFLPWWGVHALCRDVPTARQVAAEMTTEERVRAFGTVALVEIFENMFLEDFQQEYECAWLDELTSWIAWEIISKNQKSDLLWWHARSPGEAVGMIDEIRVAIKDGKIEAVFCGGLDVGRKHDLSEFVALGKSTTGQLPLRLSISLDNVPYDDQEQCFYQVITRLPFTSVLIDRNGIGAQLAENLARRTGKATGMDFTNQSKELWAVEARIQAERGATPLPMDRDIAYQIHSIKKKLASPKIIYLTQSETRSTTPTNFGAGRWQSVRRTRPGLAGVTWQN